jgi:hypothetical protein
MLVFANNVNGQDHQTIVLGGNVASQHIAHRYHHEHILNNIHWQDFMALGQAMDMNNDLELTVTHGIHGGDVFADAGFDHFNVEQQTLGGLVPWHMYLEPEGNRDIIFCTRPSHANAPFNEGVEQIVLFNIQGNLPHIPGLQNIIFAAHLLAPQ